MCRYMSNREQLMAAIDARAAAARPAARRRAARGRGRPSPAGCYCEPDSRAAQMGPRARNDSLRAGSKQRIATATGQEIGASREETSAGRDRGTAAARRRRDGHAAHARRARAGQLRRGVEPDASRSACSPSSAATPRPAPIAFSPTPSAARASCSTATRNADDVVGDQRGRRRRSRARRSAVATAT